MFSCYLQLRFESGARENIVPPPYQERESGMRSIWLGVLLAAMLLAGCGAADTGSSPSIPATPTVDDVTDPTQGATMVAIVTETAAALPSMTTGPAVRATVDPATDPTQGATPETTGASGPLLVSMHKTGGIAGVDEFFAVYSGGSAELRGRDGATTRGQVPAANLQSLQQLLASPDLATANGSYRGPAADAFIYELQIGTEGGKTRTVVVTQPSEHPPVLDQLIGALEATRTSVK